MKKLDNSTLDRLLFSVNKPYQYAGHELYSYNKDFDTSDVRFAIAFPDKYEVGASNLGHRIIYDILNSIDGCMCDRAYAPDTSFTWAFLAAFAPKSMVSRVPFLCWERKSR